MTILLTGSAGFIGFQLALKLLARGDRVVGVDNLNSYYLVKLKKDRNEILKRSKDYKFYKTDITQKENLEKVFSENKIDKICHLAAQVGVRYSLVDPFAYEKANVLGFLNTLECARKFSVKDLVYASSSSVYGHNPIPKKGFSEDDEVRVPISVYGATKRTGELLAYTYHHLYGLNCTGLRFFTVYGPWGRPDMAYFKFAEAICRGEPIDVYNLSQIKRDFTYIDDITAGIISVLDHSFPYEIFNLGSASPVRLKIFIEILEKELGKKAKLNQLPGQPGDLPATFADIKKAKAKLGFDPKTGLAQGLHEFVKWYRKYKAV